METNLISQGTLALLILEALKWLFRKFLGDIPINPNVYVAVLPVLNILAVPILAVLGLGSYPDWSLWPQLLAQSVVGTLISMFVYSGTIQKLNAAREQYRTDIKQMPPRSTRLPL